MYYHTLILKVVVATSAIFVTSCMSDTGTNDSLLTAGQKGLNVIKRIFHSFKSKIIHVWLSYFICHNKHTFGKQMPPDFAFLLAFSIKTVH